MYVQKNLKIVREFIGKIFVDSEGRRSESANNVTILAEHITGEGIISMAYQQSPYNILWCVRSDGQLACLTRESGQEVLAWTRHIVGGSFDGGDAVVESVGVIPGDGGDDQIWIIVKRTIDGSTARYVEYLKPFDYGSEQEDAFYVDSGLSLDVPKPVTALTQANPGVITVTGHGFSNDDVVIIRGVIGTTEVNRQKFTVANVSDDTFELNDIDDVPIDMSGYTAYISGGEVRKCVTSVSGLGHLVGETVDAFLDGDTAITAVVTAGGAIAIPSPGAGEIHAGLRFTPYLKLMRLEAGSNLGTAQSKLKRIKEVFVRVHRSLQMKAGNEDIQDSFDFREVGDTSSNTIEVLRCDQKVLMPSLWDRNGYVVVTQEGPFPLNIISIVIYVEVSDG